MTERAQPGARGSTMRNVEFGDVMGQYSNGWIVPATDPTLSARRYDDLDQQSFDEFDADYSATSLIVTIAAGEAFVTGWIAIDEATEITLSPDASNQEIVIGWNPDAIYDDANHETRDDADDVIVDLKANVPDEYPTLPIWDFDTDSDGVVLATDSRSIGPTVEIEMVSATEASVNDVDLGTAAIDDVTISNTLSEHHYEDNPTELEGSRSLNTTYQNTSGTALIWQVRVTADSDGTDLHSTGLSVASTESGTEIFENVITSWARTIDQGERVGFKYTIVPNGYYYRLRSTGETNNISIEFWREREWRSN